MKFYILGALLLIACTQAQQEIAPAIVLIDDGCHATQSIGESCTQNCECLKPGICLNGICSLVNLEDGQPCVANRQCLGGYCENNVCGAPENTAYYECDKICKDNYNDEPKDCSTVCRSR